MGAASFPLLLNHWNDYQVAVALRYALSFGLRGVLGRETCATFLKNKDVGEKITKPPVVTQKTKAFIAVWMVVSNLEKSQYIKDPGRIE